MERPNKDANSSIDPKVISGLEELQEPGAPDFLSELINTYLEEAPIRLSAIQTGIQSCDLIQVARACHMLKGSSANLGANLLAASCKDLEIKAALAQMDLLPAAWKRLSTECENVEREMRSVLATRRGAS